MVLVGEFGVKAELELAGSSKRGGKCPPEWLGDRIELSAWVKLVYRPLVWVGYGWCVIVDTV